jgi:hypothetical protein
LENWCGGLRDGACPMEGIKRGYDKKRKKHAFIDELCVHTLVAVQHIARRFDKECVAARTASRHAHGIASHARHRVTRTTLTGDLVMLRSTTFSSIVSRTLKKKSNVEGDSGSSNDNRSSKNDGHASGNSLVKIDTSSCATLLRIGGGSDPESDVQFSTSCK